MLEANADLGRRNTLRLPARATWFAQPESEAELAALLQDARYQSLPRVVIGDGSNLLLRADLDALVIRPAMRGMHVVEEDDRQVLIEVMAGENWEALVAETVRCGWQGLENLSLIPGAVGAAPYQNIGAYGVELADVLDSLTALSLADGRQCEFSRADCRFAYRDSFFKSHEPRRWVITRVRLRLNKSPSWVLDYADLRQRFAALSSAQQNTAGVRDLVCALRRSKLPDPQQLPNAGSFFKNPVIPAAQFRQLQQDFPAIVGYPQDGGDIKIAAGWLIEQAGWKGKRDGDLGMHAEQALVLVNYGAATGEQVQVFAERVRASVLEMFSIVLEQEPVVLP